MPRALCVLFCLAIAAAPASSGVLAGWGESPSNGGPTEQHFDCLSNTGSHSLVISVLARQDLQGVRGFTLDLTVVSGYPGVCDCFCPGSCVVPNLPPYWDLSSTGCRPGAISVATGFPADAGTSAVENPFLPGMLLPHPYTIETGYAGVYTNPVPFTYGRYVVECAVPVGAEFNMAAGHEYYVATITVKNAHSGDCAGCCTSVLFNPAVSLDLGLGYGVPVNDGSGVDACWQGVEAYRCNVVPARAATWGALKSAYR